GRVALPGTGRRVVPDRSPLATRRRHPPVVTLVTSPGGRHTANGSRPRAPWARLTTIPVHRRPVKAGSPSRQGRWSHPPEWALPGATSHVARFFPDRRPRGAA